MTPPFQPTVTLDRAVFNACYALCQMAGTQLPDATTESTAQIQKRGCDAIQVLQASGIPNSAAVTAQINAAIATLSASLSTVAFTGEYADLLNKPALGSGTVTSVQLSVPSLLDVTSPPVTGAGLIQAVLTPQAANRVLAGPTSGAPAIPDFRKIVAADITLATNKILLGVANLATESTPSAVLDVIGSTRGSLLYRGAAGWAPLAPGIAGYILKSNGAGADPSYQVDAPGPLTSAHIFVGNAANAPADVAASGDVTLDNTGAFTVTKINGTLMSGLATGILKNTTGTGVPSIAVAGDFPTLNQNTTGSAAKWTTARNLAGNSVDGSADVAFANKFIVQGTADAGLSGAQFLGALATGIVKNTTTTGVLSIAVAGDFPALPYASSTLATDKIYIGVGNVATAVTTNVYNIVAYGASPAGSAAANATAIGNAIAAAVAAGGGTIYTPDGWFTTTEITVASSVGLTFLFADRYSSGWKASVNTAPVMTITGSNVTIKNGGFDGAYVSGASSGTAGVISLRNADNITIDGCLVQNGLRNGVLIFGACDNIKIINSRLYRNYCSIRSFEDVPNNTTCSNVTVNKCEFISNWDHTGNDQTGGIKLQTNGVTAQSYGHSITNNYFYNVGLLPIEMWTGEDGIIRDSVISLNRIFGIDTGDQWGISLNGCVDVVVSANTVRLTNAFVGIEAANECVRCLIDGNTINLFAADGITKSSGTAIGVYNNAGSAPTYTKVTGNELCGGADGLHTQNTVTTTEFTNNKLSSFSGNLCILSNSSYVVVKLNTFSGACASQLFIDAPNANVTDIEVAYNTYIGDAAFRNIWGYNNDTAFTLTNFHFHHNNGVAATFTGYDSWNLLWNANELINVIREDNYYVAGVGKADWPYWASDDVPIAPFAASEQEFSIPIASKFTFAVAANAGDQWFKIFSYNWGMPLTTALHVECNFLATDNTATSQTFTVSGSPYGQDAGIMKWPDGYYQGGSLKGIIYDNAGGGPVHEIWLRFPATGGGTVTVGGADFAGQWIIVPSAVTVEPTWNANHYELTTNVLFNTLQSRYIAADNIRIVAGGYANFGATLSSTGYGIRDNAGVVEVKNSGGSWAAPLYTAVTSLAGTANEITASAATGAVTLSLPTALTFTGKTVTGGTFASPTLSGTLIGSGTIGGSTIINTSGAITGGAISGTTGTFSGNGIFGGSSGSVRLSIGAPTEDTAASKIAVYDGGTSNIYGIGLSKIAGIFGVGIFANGTTTSTPSVFITSSGLSAAQANIGVGSAFGVLDVGHSGSLFSATVIGDKSTPANSTGIYLRGTSADVGISTAGAPLVFYFGGPGTSEGARFAATMATLAGGLTLGSTTLLTTSIALADGTAAQAATMTNGPVAGNPTKWISINDNGTTRYIPTW